MFCVELCIPFDTLHYNTQKDYSFLSLINAFVATLVSAWSSNYIWPIQEGSNLQQAQLRAEAGPSQVPPHVFFKIVSEVFYDAKKVTKAWIAYTSLLPLPLSLHYQRCPTSNACTRLSLAGHGWCKLATETLPVGTIKALTPGYGRPMDYHCHDDYNQRQIDLIKSEV